MQAVALIMKCTAGLSTLGLLRNKVVVDGKVKQMAFIILQLHTCIDEYYAYKKSS